MAASPSAASPPTPTTKSSASPKHILCFRAHVWFLDSERRWRSSASSPTERTMKSLPSSQTTPSLEPVQQSNPKTFQMPTPNQQTSQASRTSPTSTQTTTLTTSRRTSKRNSTRISFRLTVTPSFLFIKTLPPYECIEHNIPICLPPKEKGAPKNTLVCSSSPSDALRSWTSTKPLSTATSVPSRTPTCFSLYRALRWARTLQVDFEGYSYDIYLKIRPYFYYFLEEVSKLYEVVIFTASQKVYVSLLPPHRLAMRTSC